MSDDEFDAELRAARPHTAGRRRLGRRRRTGDRRAGRASTRRGRGHRSRRAARCVAPRPFALGDRPRPPRRPRSVTWRPRRRLGTRDRARPPADGSRRRPSSHARRPDPARPRWRSSPTQLRRDARRAARAHRRARRRLRPRRRLRLRLRRVRPSADTDGARRPASPRWARGRRQPTPDHSTTNIQEAGVDEPDIVETDGDRVVIGLRRRAARRRRGSHEVTGTLDLTSYAGADEAQLLMSGDRVLVMLGSPVPLLRPRPSMYDYGYSRGTGEHDRPARRHLRARRRSSRRCTPKGSFVDARMVDGTVRLVVQQRAEASPSRAGAAGIDGQARSGRIRNRDRGTRR